MGDSVFRIHEHMDAKDRLTGPLVQPSNTCPAVSEVVISGLETLGSDSAADAADAVPRDDGGSYGLKTSRDHSNNGRTVGLFLSMFLLKCLRLFWGVVRVQPV